MDQIEINKRFDCQDVAGISKLMNRNRDSVMEAFRQLAQTVDECARDCREKSLALTALEEASMWAMRAIERHGIVDRMMAASQDALADAAADALADASARVESPKVEITRQQVARSLAGAIEGRGLFEMGA